MSKKLTKREMLNQIKAHLTDGEEIAFIDHELELLDKKNVNRKPTARQTENEAIKSTLLDMMEDDTAYTVNELCKLVSNDGEEPMSGQRMTAILRQLIADGAIIRTEDKRKAYFAKM